MPEGLLRQNCPTDAIGNEIHLARIATGESEETASGQPVKREYGLAGAKTCAEFAIPESDKVAVARWA